MYPPIIRPIERLLLVHNSPRVKRYFDRLGHGLSGQVRVLRCGVGAGLRLPPPPAGTIEEIIDYGMRRKRARPNHGAFRLDAYRRIYRVAARLHYDRVSTRIERDRPDALGVWGGNAVDARAVVVAARHAGVPCFRFENGFLPDTTQMDLRGVNFESSVPRDPQFYRSWGAAAGGAQEAKPTLLCDLDNLGPSEPEPLRLPERYVFVPFQVALDSQILLNSPWVRDMHHLFAILLEAARRVARGPVTLVFKEHPRCPLRYGELHRAAAASGRASFVSGVPTSELIRRALGVATINSTVGAEALMLGRPVLALGNAVYDVPGVASSARSVDEVAGWLGDVWSGDPLSAPLREPFLAFLAREHLVPEKHQEPGRAHFRAVAAKLQGGGIAEPALV
jgi:capsular polysaccharide export protein